MAAAALVLLAVVANKASDRLGVPALLLFLLIGMLAGSEGIGGIEFADVGAAQDLGVVALAFILFAGGWTLVVLVRRDDQFVVPQGSTVLEAGDTVLLLADDYALTQLNALLQAEH